MPIARALIALCLSLCLSLMVSAAAAQADRISDINRHLDGLPALEGRIIDEQRQIQALLADTSRLLVATGNGRTVAMTAVELDREIGMIHDWLAVFGTPAAVSGWLSDSRVEIIHMAIGAGYPRTMIVNGIVGMIENEQSRRRAELQARHAELTRELDEARIRADALRAERDSLIAARDGTVAPMAGGLACFDPAATNTASVSWIAPMYGQTVYAMRGDYICNLRDGFTQLIASQLRTFHCDMQRTPPDCQLAGVTEIRPEQHPEYGLRYILDNGNWFVIGPPF